MEEFKSLTRNYERNRHGKFQRQKTNWQTTVVGIIFCLILIPYIGTYVERDINIPREVKAESIAETCRLVKENFYQCTDEETLIKWKEYKEARDTKQTFTVTGYSSRPEETDDTPEIGATGENIWELYKKGMKICASNDFPFNTLLTVENMGTCVVKDRMNKRYTGTNRIDWYFGYDTNAALLHGIKRLHVEKTN